MEKERKHGQMVRFTEEIMFKEIKMDKDNSFGPMEAGMKENSKIIILKGLEFTNGLKENSHFQMEEFIKVPMLRIYNTDMVNFNGQMAVNIKVIGNKVNRMVKESTFNLTEKKKLAFGSMEREIDG